MIIYVMLQFEPVIQPGNEGIVHHIALFACNGQFPDASDGFAWDCIENIMPGQYQCLQMTFVWAVGGNVSCLHPLLTIFHHGPK